MKKWLQRVAGIYLLSVGLACLFFPFRDYRTEDVTVDTVAARAVGYVDQRDEAAAELKQAWALDDRSRQTLPEEFREALETLSAQEAELKLVSFRAAGDELMACLPPEGVPMEDGGTFLIRDRDCLFEVRNPSASFRKKILDTGSQLQMEAAGLVTVRLRGEVLPADSGWAVKPEDWKEIPAIGRLFEPLSDRPESVSPADLPTREEWEKFARSAGGKAVAAGASRVIYEGRLYEVTPDTRYLEEKITAPRLGAGRKGAGGIFAIAGLALLAMVYRGPRIEGAIRIGAPLHQIAGDAVVVIFAMLAAVPVIDFLLHRWFGVEPIADEEFLRFMGVFFLVFAIPLASLYLSTIGAQWFQADEKGVRLRSLFSDRFIPWDELSEIKAEKTAIFPVVRAGIPLSRTLQRSLVFVGAGERIGVMEPVESVKREVLARAAKHAPAEWKENLETAGEQWKGYEAW